MSPTEHLGSYGGKSAFVSNTGLRALGYSFSIFFFFCQWFHIQLRYKQQAWSVIFSLSPLSYFPLSTLAGGI